MKMLAVLVYMFALWLTAALANTEKAIFTAPEAVALSDTQPSLEALQLRTLTHPNSTLRTSLDVTFPSESTPRGRDHWYLLRDLVQGQRYELRVCWAAIQPTQFWLDTHTLQETFDTPELIQSLSAFAEATSQKQQDISRPVHSSQSPESLLFLRVQAAADYFTTNKTLMSQPPAVHVDLVLDPFLGNIFPRSLVPTAGYIVGLAFVGWYLSGLAWRFLASSPAKQHKD